MALPWQGFPADRLPLLLPALKAFKAQPLASERLQAVLPVLVCATVVRSRTRSFLSSDASAPTSDCALPVILWETARGTLRL